MGVHTEQPTRTPTVRRWQVPAGGAAVGVVVWWLVHRSMVDDAYITLTYARTLGLHGQWGMYPGLESNTATSPLNVLLLGAGTAVTRDAVLAVGLVLVGVFVMTAVWLARIGAELGVPGWRAPALGVGVVATSPLLLSTAGLESHLAVALMVGLARYALAGSWWAAGVVSGLLVLTRPDLVVFGLLAVVLAARSWWRVALAAVAASLPWFALSWVWLESAVPDTLLLKAGLTWGAWNYGNGVLLWAGIFPAAVALSAAPAAVGLAFLPAWLRSGVRPVGGILGLGSLAHGLLFVVMGAGPFHWYYAPLIGGLAVLAALTAARARSITWQVLAAVFVVVCAATAVNDGLPRDRTPIGSNWASATQYEQVTSQLPDGAVIQSPGEVGALAYHCYTRCLVVDWFADRGQLAPMLADRRATAGPALRAVLDINYSRWDPAPAVPVQYVMVTAPADPVGSPMVGSWGDGRTWWLRPAA